MQPDSITLTVTPQVLNVVMTAVANLPFKDAAPVMQILQQQIQAQLQGPPRPMAVVPSQPEAALPVAKQG